MTALSDRYAGPAVGLLLVVLIPLGMTLFSPRRAENCQNPEALRATSQIPHSIPMGEKLESRSDDVVQWSEGTVDIPDRKGELYFQIVRSYDWRKHALNVLNLVNPKMEPESQQLIHAGGPEEKIPIHIGLDHTGAASEIVAYTFLDGATSVEAPFTHELLKAVDHLIEGSTPLTILVIAGDFPRHSIPDAQAEAVEWLVAASRYTKASCSSP